MATIRAPADSEVAHSREIIDYAKKKTLPIRTAVNDFAEQTKNIFRSTKTHRASTPPMEALPPELLAVIFIEYCNMDTDPWITPAPPLNLMWICVRWRRIVLDTPQLWTRISSSVPMINLWVNRSRGLPLDLTLNLIPNDSASVLNALIPQAHRWERVDLILRPDSNSILSPVKGRLRSLKRLKVSSVDAVGFLDFFQGAPQLAEVWLGNLVNAATAMLPWRQLRDCTLPHSAATLYALKHAKNVRTCRLDMSIPLWKPMPAILPQPCRPNLNTLIIHWRPEGFSFDLFFSSLTLPSLQRLEIRLLPPLWGGPSRSNDNLGLTLLRFFERSSSHLAVLTLDEFPVSTTQLVDYLAFMPSLISLDIEYALNGYIIGDEFLRCLTFNHANHLLPHLRVLSLRGRTEFRKESLDALIMSRRDISPQDAGVSPLINLVLDCSAPINWSYSEPPSFHRFIPGGLNITYGRYWGMEHRYRHLN